MDPAAAVEASDRVRLAPPLHRLRPFLGHVVLRESLQGAHELAVDEPCRERIEVAGDASPPRLRRAARDLPATSPSRMSSRASATRPMAHAAGSHLAPDLDRPPRPLARARQVAGQHPLVGADDRKPRVRRRLPRPSRRRSARASQPRTGAMSAVSRSRCMATRTAAPAAATCRRPRTHAACARSQVSIVTSRWPAA